MGAWLRAACLALGLVTLLLLSACVSRTGTGAERAVIVTGMESAFPTLERLALQGLSSVDGCDRVTFARGTFYVTRQGYRCPAPGRTPDPETLDPETLADMEAVRGASPELADLSYASIQRDAAGRIVSGQFSLGGSCSLFVFEPGYELPDADSYDPVAIDEDWYLLAC